MSAKMDPAMRTMFVCLAFLLPYLSSTQSQNCELNNVSRVPQSCSCSGFSLTCTAYWPRADELPKGLQELSISETVHTHLGSCFSTFSNLTGLRTLDLSGNQINTLTSSSFDAKCFPDIENLILDDNDITLDDESTFDGLVHLKTLSLNRALEDSDGIAPNLTRTLRKSNLPKLQELNLNGNQLGVLSADTFSYQYEDIPANISTDLRRDYLSRIHLCNISLGAVNRNLFQQHMLPNLTYLDLSLNKITALDKENVQNFDNFSSLTINLTGNPFTCNCQLKDFTTWLVMTEITVVDKANLTCSNAYYIKHIDAVILEISPDDLNCTELNNLDLDPVQPAYYLLIAVLGVIGLLGLVILFMRRKEILKLCQQVKQATKETFDTHHTSYVYSDIARAPRDTPEHSAVDV